MTVDTVTTAAFVLLYITITLVIDYVGDRKTKNSDNYLVAGQSDHPIVIALSYGITFISTSAIVGFSSVAANPGMGLIWLTVLNIGVGILIAFIVFGKKTREIGQRLSDVTYPDLMGKIYKSPLMQYICGLIIVIAMPISAIMMIILQMQFKRRLA